MSGFEVKTKRNSIRCRVFGDATVEFYLHDIDDDIKKTFSDIENFEQTGKFECDLGGNSPSIFMVRTNKIYLCYEAYSLLSSMTIEINTDIGCEFVKEIYAKICEILN